MNGQEQENEVFEGASSAEYWMYDSRTGRRFENDPLVYEYQSPYVCFNNNPIYYADPQGLEGKSSSDNGSGKSSGGDGKDKGKGEAGKSKSDTDDKSKDPAKIDFGKLGKGKIKNWINYNWARLWDSNFRNGIDKMLNDPENAGKTFELSKDARGGELAELDPKDRVEGSAKNGKWYVRYSNTGGVMASALKDWTSGVKRNFEKAKHKIVRFAKQYRKNVKGNWAKLPQRLTTFGSGWGAYFSISFGSKASNWSQFGWGLGNWRKFNSLGFERSDHRKTVLRAAKVTGKGSVLKWKVNNRSRFNHIGLGGYEEKGVNKGSSGSAFPG